MRAEHVVFAEVDLEAVLRLRAGAHSASGASSALPGIERDIAVVVSVTQPAGEVEAVIREQGGPHLRAVRLFDVYRGAPLGRR